MRQDQEITGEQEYVLGTDADELARLGLQHELWSEVARAGWRRAGFGEGQSLLDVGCGPGYASFELARLVGARGRVVAVDMSQRFIDHLKAKLSELRVHQIETRVSNVEELDLPAASFDGAFARWVICFVSRPEAVVRGVARALKPGAAYVVQDYCHYEGMTVGPWHEIFARVFGAVAETWRARGGDPNAGSLVPTVMQECGFEVREINPIARIARPGSPLWQWPETFFSNQLPTLVERGAITAAERDTFETQWQARAANPAAFFSTPPMVEVIGIKK
jgi:ubiquinone/menaquinone biosynthesis C-methylase UbiE